MMTRCRVFVLVCLVALASFAASAQKRAGLMGDLLADITDVESKIVGLAKAMPESTYAWRPMPGYPWLFDGSPDKPNARGLALITYVQWLGSWLESYPDYEDYEPSTVKDVRWENAK